MNDRLALGLALGTGYVLGRTKKATAALVVAGVVAGRRMNLSAVPAGDLIDRRLREHPRLREIGDAVRREAGGIGRAVFGTVVEPGLDALADRLHDRTARLRARLDEGADADEKERPGAKGDGER